MNWHFKKNNEVDNFVEIGYSFEKNDTCDGVILYDKTTKTSTVKRLSQGSCLFDAKRGFQFIHMLVRENRLSDHVFNLRTG